MKLTIVQYVSIPLQKGMQSEDILQVTGTHQDKTQMALETKPFQANPSPVNSYLYQQTMPKNKEAFPWIPHELDTLTRISSPYHIKESIIIPHEAEKQLPDIRYQLENTTEETTSISSKKDYILHQEFEISTSLSGFDYMLRQLEADDVPPPNYTEEEETETWTVLDSF